MISPYKEPVVSFLVLDYLRPDSARVCLQSIERHVKFPHKVIYCHNGAEEYPIQFLHDGLIDELILPRKNGGLGLGTRALFAACFSPLAIYWQVDQIMGRDFEIDELETLVNTLAPENRGNSPQICASISLAGPVCGKNIYSERAHAILTKFYRSMEYELPLSFGGAGPYDSYPWREGQIQEYYKKNNYIHFTDWPQLAIDNGRDAIRENPDGSIWKHFPDSKSVYLVGGEPKERHTYPKFNDKEWEYVLKYKTWPAGQIPENEVKESFHVWN